MNKLINNLIDYLLKCSVFKKSFEPNFINNNEVKSKIKEHIQHYLDINKDLKFDIINELIAIIYPDIFFCYDKLFCNIQRFHKLIDDLQKNPKKCSKFYIQIYNISKIKVMFKFINLPKTY